MSALTEDQLKAAAQLRLKRALDSIQRAQNEMLCACQELSALCGAYPQYRAASKLYDRLHAFWYRIETLRGKGKCRLDSVNVEALQRRAAEQNSPTQVSP